VCRIWVRGPRPLRHRTSLVSEPRRRPSQINPTTSAATAAPSAPTARWAALRLGDFPPDGLDMVRCPEHTPVGAQMD
jgi:hypothetical protein